MTTAKVDIKIGPLSFNGEGDKEWLAKQLDKLIQHAPSLLQIVPAEPNDAGEGDERKAPARGKSGTLAAFLASAKGAKDSQVAKFLATAEWLHRKGQKRVTTRNVSDALDTNNQGKLRNASDCCLQNAGKGFLERSGKEFYVTDEGRASLGV